MSSHRAKSDSGLPFHVVLDRLIDQGSAAIDAASRWRPAPACDWTILADAAAPAASFDAAARLYVDADTADATPQEASADVERAVTRELQLSDGLAPADLERIRRKFAYRNHPDRAGPDDQALALQRMTVANVLIDRALKTARARAQ